MTAVSNQSIHASQPSTLVGLPGGYQLIGGGAKVFWNPQTQAGNLLVHSYPTSNYWNAKSKDHHYSSPSTITAYAIGIQDYIPGFGYIDVNSVQTCCMASVQTGYANNGTYFLTGYAPTCVGARSSSSVGRLLTGLRPPYYISNNPDNNFYTVQSADCIVTASGTLEAFGTQIRKRP